MANIRIITVNGEQYNIEDVEARELIASLTDTTYTFIEDDVNHTLKIEGTDGTDQTIKLGEDITSEKVINALEYTPSDVLSTACDLGLSINTENYVMTVELKNNKGTVLATKEVDLPIESMVVDASYNNGKLTLTLQNGESIKVDISSIVSGLVNDSFTIAGIDMKDNITASELSSALSVPTLETTNIDFSKEW